MIFAAPWALLGLVALPAAAGIYVLHNRSRPKRVSSLMLWTDQSLPRQGGRTVQRLQLPLLLILELLALALLVLAAVNPHMQLGATRQRVVVILDDSYSMNAGDDSPRDRVMKEVRKRFRTGRINVQLVLAGREPRVLGEPVSSYAHLKSLLDQWTCQSPRADITSALALGRTVGGASAKLWVLTDKSPPPTFEDQEVFWQAWGRPEPNRAIVGAMRGSRRDEPYGVLEVANFGPDSRETVLRVTDDSGEDILPAQRIALGAGASATLLIDLPHEAGAVVATIDDEVLAIDDRAELLAPAERSIRVRVAMNDERLAEDVVDALSATQRVQIVEGSADLVVTDHEGPDPAPNVWTLRLVPSENPQAFTGPFLIDRAHPLCDGLSLDGVIWAADGETALAGRSAISAGNTVLLTDASLSHRRRIIRVALSPRHSTLTDSIAWPVLLWNLLDYRAASLAGPSETNVRLGQPVVVSVPLSVQRVAISTPDGTVIERTVRDGMVVVPTDRVGRYRIEAGQRSYAVAVNALEPSESDLRANVTGQWGQWATRADRERHYSSVAWTPLLGAMVIMVIHQFLLGRSRGRMAS
jgi:hypothetical protein